MATEHVRMSKGRNFFVNKNFAMIWIGGTIARLSEGIVYAAFGLWIFNSIVKDQSSGATAIKGITLVALFALFVLGLPAGVFVDRWANKKRVLLITSALRAFTALLPIAVALFLSFTTVRAPWMVALSLGSIYLATFLISTFTHFSVPVSYVLFADCVKEEDYSRANGLLLTTSFLATMLGAPLGILLFSMVGFPGALLFDALLYTVTFIATWYINVETPKPLLPHKPFFSSFKEGFAFCAKSPLIVLLLFTLVLINTWNGVLSVLGISFVTQNLHTAYISTPAYASVGYYGTLGLTVGIAITAGSFVFGLISRRMGEKRVFSYSLFFAGLLILVVSRLTQFLPAMIVIIFISLLTAGVNVTAVPLYLWVTPRHFLGRVRAIVDVVMNLAAVGFGGISLWLSTTALRGLHLQFLGTTFTPVDTLFAFTGIICVAGGLLVIRSLAKTRKVAIQAAPASEVTTPETVPEPMASGKL